MGKKKMIEEFVADARRVHGDKYGYEKVVYISAKCKVTIICPVHGDFEQTPNNYLNGRGCTKCKRHANRSDTESFVKRAVEVHGDKYDYGKVLYEGSHKKVIVTCKKHGDFEQTPGSHSEGRGCPKCAGRECTDTESFVKLAVEVHGDKYGYEKVVYISAKCKVTIICPVHGDFEQTPGHHLRGCGCPKCATAWSGDGAVYVMSTPEGHNKIGIAKSGTEHGRLQQILKSQQTKAPTAIAGLSLVCAYSFNDGSFTDARRFEGKAHRHFKSRCKKFSDKFDGYAEFFTVPVSEICSYLEQQGGKLVTIKQ